MAISNPSLPSVPDGVHVDELALGVGTLTITARTTAPRAVCPQCGQGSTRVHSAYWRSLKDLPWQDRAVTWRVQVRRFRCGRCARSAAAASCKRPRRSPTPHSHRRG